ncbi:sugar transferase [Chelativorans sp. Marseille-P2723]|uniref:sugar transferase n=1 Tax=Chelativorans sp. Marseille-P2723 TaxID=2709133 RepID=UPI002484D331|nr:sugar transferase [Chelativorans sp. Marseille-P2723]
MAEPVIGTAARQSRIATGARRGLDVAIAIIILLPALPVMLVAAALIRATSKGPALFVQERLGRDCVPFRCYKLRTMYQHTPSVPTHEAHAGAITPVGRFLRMTKLDELPQLWNVIRGDMALVGPRPCLPDQRELISHRRRLGVFSSLPGITGLAQLRGIDMSQPELCAKTDAEYLTRGSVRLDLWLLACTLLRRRLP